MTWVCPWRQSRAFVFPSPWKATNPLVALRAGRRHTGNVVSLLCPCECRSNHCRSFSALRRPLRMLSCVTASKPLLRIPIVSVQQCSRAGWTSSSFLEETKCKSGGEFQTQPSHVWLTVCPPEPKEDAVTCRDRTCCCPLHFSSCRKWKMAFTIS